MEAGSDRREAIQRVFGAAAARYAVSPVHKGGPDLDAMVAAAGLTGDEAVLDMGCGAGHTALAFAARAGSVEALDLTAEMVEQGRALAAERGLANVRFQPGDVVALPFEDARFDVVTSRLSAHHYAQPQAAVHEAARVLKPGGVLLLVDSVAPPDPAQDTFLNAFELLRDASHVRDHSVAQWCAMFEAAGLAADHVGSWPLRIDFEAWVERVETPALERRQLAKLFDEATDEMCRAFRIEPDRSFDIPAALVRRRKPAAG